PAGPARADRTGRGPRRGRPAPQPPDDAVPPPAELPAPFLADPLDDRDDPPRRAQLAAHADPGRAPGRASPVPRALRSLRALGLRLPAPGREPVPGLRGRGGRLPGVRSRGPCPRAP